MQRNKGMLALSLALLIAAALGCKMSATTANLSSLKIGSDKEVKTEKSAFDSGDTVYALAVVSNAPGKTKVKGRLVIEDVPGQTKGPVPGLEKTLDLDGSTTATFTFTPPPSGWPAGKYKIEVILMTEGGEQKDQKTADFSVS